MRICVNTVLILISPRTNITRAPYRRRNGEAVTRAVNLGDLITADHKVARDNFESRNNHRYAVVVKDLPRNGSRRIRAKTKFHQKSRDACKSSWNPRGKQKSFFTGNSLEFGKACEDLSWNHCTSTPHRSETNCIAKRAVRRVKEGTSAVLLQSGLNESWWADSLECYTYLRNVTNCGHFVRKTVPCSNSIRFFMKVVVVSEILRTAFDFPWEYGV